MTKQSCISPRMSSSNARIIPCRIELRAMLWPNYFLPSCNVWKTEAISLPYPLISSLSVHEAFLHGHNYQMCLNKQLFIWAVYHLIHNWQLSLCIRTRYSVSRVYRISCRGYFYYTKCLRHIYEQLNSEILPRSILIGILFTFPRTLTSFSYM